MDKNAVFRYVEFAREELQKLTKQKTEGGQRSGRAEEAGYKPAAEGSS